ncbi:MAG: hypothetical protein ACJA1C_003308 [Crocinitomicaceae bacterium]|jgi:hypothetical protein
MGIMKEVIGWRVLLYWHFVNKILHLEVRNSKNYTYMSEPILHKTILWYKSKMQAFPGKMTVTNDRFTYAKAPKWAMMFGALSILFINSAKGVKMIDDDIKNLKFAKGREVGKKGYTLDVTTSAGETFSFLFDDKLLEIVKSVIRLEEEVMA